MIAKILSKNQIYEIPLIEGESLRESLAKNGFFLSAHCAGEGACGRCKARLISSTFPVCVDGDGFFLTCKCYPKGDIELEVFIDEEIDYTIYSKRFEKPLNLYLDVGTTTLCYELLDRNGKKLASLNTLNPQRAFGADVLSRIKYASEGGLKVLQSAVLSVTRKTLALMKNDIGFDNVDELIVCGNTTMLHIFAGIDPTPIGVYPYTPVFCEERNFDGREFDLSVSSVKLLPSFSAFIGSDVVAGVSASKILSDDIALYIDLGTNGEIVLKKYDQYFVTSTAAGPAFEGGCISCGMGGVKGAINVVREVGPFFDYETIGSVKAKGICGAGLCDLIALLLKKSVISCDGTLLGKGVGVKGGVFYLTPDVRLTQSDIREFQLAKSAIRSGIEILLKKSGINACDVNRVYLAGGMGSQVNIKSACEVGLFPKEFESKFCAVGNLALSGATKYMENKANINHFLTNSKIVDLTMDQSFDKIFIENTSFFKR